MCFYRSVYVIVVVVVVIIVSIIVLDVKATPIDFEMQA